MLSFTTHELRLIAEKRNIKDYKKMSREELLRTFDESERFIKNLSKNGHERIAKIQNLPQNEIKQAIKMHNLSRNELEQIAKMRHTKNYKNMSKKGLLIALLKSERNHTDLYKSKSNNVEIEETKKTFNEIRDKSSLKKYQEGLETKMRGSDFVFESVDLLYYSLHKISLNRGGSYIDSPDWIKNKKATINPKSKDNKCLRDGIKAALNHEKIKHNPERISNLKPFLISIIERR